MNSCFLRKALFCISGIRLGTFHVLGEPSDELQPQTRFDEGIRKAYSRYKMEIEDTNGIMICLGTYQTSSECDIVHGSADILVPRDSKNAEFRTYVDLEKPLSDAFNVPISLCEEYEKKHTVLFPSPLEAREFHHYLKIEDAFANGQETAVQNVLTKSIKN